VKYGWQAMRRPPPSARRGRWTSRFARCSPRVRFAPLPPGICTSAGRVRALQLALAVVWVGCSCCASRIRTSSGRRRTWSKGFSMACGGSDSTGRGAEDRRSARAVLQSERLDRYRAMPNGWSRAVTRTTATARPEELQSKRDAGEKK